MPGVFVGLDATIIVEAAFTAGASAGGWFGYLTLDDAARGRLDTGTLAPDAIWTDISDFVLSCQTRRGSNRVMSPTIRYEAGTATIVLDNSDRRFDPTNLAGPYVVSGITQVTPMRAVRVRVNYLGTTYDIFRGFADEWRMDPPSDPDYATVTLTASDAFKVLGNVNRLAAVSVGAGETADVRIGRILDSAGWPAADRILTTSTTTLQATTLSGNALTELRLVEDTDLGEFFISEAGVAIFRSRATKLSDARSITPVATFGDGSSGLAYESVELAYDDATLANRALISRTGGTEQQSDDSASQALYLVRTVQRDGLIMQTDTEAANYAGFIVYVASQPELRFSTMTIFPREDPTNLWPQVLGRFIGDRITIKRQPPGGGSPIVRDVFIEGIEHVMGEDWRTTFTLQSATRYAFFILDHAVLGQLDSNALGY